MASHDLRTAVKGTGHPDPTDDRRYWSVIRGPVTDRTEADPLPVRLRIHGELVVAALSHSIDQHYVFPETSFIVLRDHQGIVRGTQSRVRTRVEHQPWEPECCQLRRSGEIAQLHFHWVSLIQKDISDLGPELLLATSSNCTSITSFLEMNSLRAFRLQPKVSVNLEDDELRAPLRVMEKIGTEYQDSASSEDGGSSERQDMHHDYQRARPQRNWVLLLITLFLTIILTILSTFHVLLLRELSHHKTAGNHQHESPHAAKQHTDCGASVADAKAKGCVWDELTKAWIPSQCPQFGLDEYKLEGMLANPHDNATSWPYYADQNGEVEVSLNVLAEDEARDPLEPVWTTSRQHLTHCAWSLKRVLWSYENGKGHYDKISRLHHVNHCVDTLLRRAVRLDDGVDLITTTAKVHFGWCDY